MLLYLSSSIYIFTALEISLPHPNVVSIYRGGTVYRYRVAYSEGPTSISLDSGGVVV